MNSFSAIQEFLHRYENAFLLLAVGWYLLGMLAMWSQLFFRADDSSPRIEALHNQAAFVGRFFLGIGAAFHLLSLVGQGAALLGVRVGVAGLFAWILVLAYLVFGAKLGRNTLGAFVSPVVLLASLYSLTAHNLHPQVPPSALEMQWKITHVFVIVFSYVSLAFAFASALIYLLQEGLLKRKKLQGLWQRLPSLQVADELIYRATAFGLALLTLGIFIGVVWQMRYHPEYAPLSDPKVISSLLTWITFAIYLGARRWLGWRGRRTNLVVVYGFVLLVVSFFGAPHVLTGVTR
jgi:ABC-type uncharacterized transport system permease subunit